MICNTKNAFAVFLFVFLNHAIIFCQEEICSNVIPEDSPYGYRKFENRCEGIYIPKYVGIGIIEIVSFTIGEIDFNWAEKTILKVSSKNILFDDLNIRAKSLDREIHYQMDSNIERDEELAWPIEPVIFNKNIFPDTLGVYGWYGKEDDKIFLPVLVQESDKINDSLNIYILKIRPLHDLSNFRWAIYGMFDDKTCDAAQVYSSFIDYHKELTADSIIDIYIRDIYSLTNRFCLDIQYRPLNHKWKFQIIKIQLPSEN